MKVFIFALVAVCLSLSLSLIGVFKTRKERKDFDTEVDFEKKEMWQ